MNKKIIVSGIVVIISISLLWYLFIKKSDYIISFKAKTATGTVFQGIQEWSTAQMKINNENFSTIEQSRYNFIIQKLKKGNSEFEYIWEINSVNDSVTAISVGIKEINNSIYNRLTVPFFNTEFKKQQLKKITDFKNGLFAHLENLKVKIDGEGTSEETFVAYINLKSVMQEKAQTMIMNDVVATGFLEKNNIKIIGRPYVEIVNWDLETEKLDFNYCFPIAKNTPIIPDPNVKFKILPAIKGLKATYNGNFRTSDRAWFALLDYAKRHKISLENKPLEHFLANPFNGGNELEWETKIIIPFSSKK